MAVRRIVKQGEDILGKKSKPVVDFDEKLGQLIDDMIETMHEGNGVGLAAVQVGVLRRVVVIEPEPGDVIALVNPQIVSSEGACEDTEGCLSVPGKWGIVERPEKLVVRAKDRLGRAFELTAEGYAARIVCHELDHLDGILFTSKVLRYIDPEK